MDAKTLPELVRLDLGAPQRQKHEEYWWLCPFHAEDTPSLQVDYYSGASKWRYKCWGCGQEGDAFDWLVNYRNMSTGDAWRVLHGETGAPVTTSSAPAFAYGAEPPAQDWQDAALDAVLRAAADLPGTPAHKWLLSRGLRPETIQRAMLGYNATWREVMPGCWLPPGVTIPAFTEDTLWYVNVRLGAQEARRRNDKYMALAGSRLASLYNAPATLEAPVAIVVEGEFDALLLQQHFASSELAVVTMGSANATPAPRWKKYLAWLEKLMLVLDKDSAGERGVERWRQVVTWIETIKPPDVTGKDVTDWWKNGADLRAWLEPYLSTPAPEKTRVQTILAAGRTAPASTSAQQALIGA